VQERIAHTYPERVKRYAKEGNVRALQVSFYSITKKNSSKNYLKKKRICFHSHLFFLANSDCLFHFGFM
jgi:hypothetical protein